MNLKVVTFNLRMDNQGDGVNYFFNRSPLILDTIAKSAPDILCFQEATDRILPWLKANLTDYTVVGTGRGADLTDEANPVAFRKDRFSLFALDQFWLSPTPHIPGSRYEDQSICPRICMNVTLCYEENGMKKLLRIYNSHLDHIGKSARLLGMTSILERITADNRVMRCPIILAGDFNAAPDEPCIRTLEGYTEFPLTDVTKGIPVSFHGFGHLSDGDKIDYIFTDMPVVHPAEAWTVEQNGIYLSDHYPIEATLCLD